MIRFTLFTHLFRVAAITVVFASGINGKFKEYRIKEKDGLLTRL